MYLRVLFHQLKQIDAKSKFVLVALIHRYGIGGALPTDNGRRTQDLGLPLRELGRALAQLLSAGYLAEDAAVGRQAGRPSRRYSISGQFRQLVLRSDERSTAHSDLIKKLIEGPDVLASRPSEKETQKLPRGVGTGGKAVPKRNNRLSLPNRLLLAVLFAHADEFGVVDDLGRTGLSRLTGIDAAGMKQRVRKLVDLGYIRRHVPGVARPLFSGKLKSVFVLNLNHPQLGGRNSPVLVHESSVRADRDSMYVRELMGEVRGFQRGSGLPTSVRIIKLFLHEPVAAFSQLEVNLCRWASELLAHQATGRDASAIIRGPVTEFFRASAIHSRMKKGVPGPPTSIELIAHDEWEELVEHFLLMASLLADECIERFFVVRDLDLNLQDLMLMPQNLSLDNGCMVLLVRRSVTRLGSSSVVIREVAAAARWQAYDRESDIDSTLLFESGLLERAACEPLTVA